MRSKNGTSYGCSLFLQLDSKTEPTNRGWPATSYFRPELKSRAAKSKQLPHAKRINLIRLVDHPERCFASGLLRRFTPRNDAAMWPLLYIT
jgi:hypothetical protein